MINVLLVDHDPPILELTQFFLEMDGRFKVDTATSTRSALDKMAKKTYDAIVADYAMPEMNGLELLKLLRNQGNDIPFIMFTGKGREDVAIEALNYGADYYLQKGGDPRSQFTELTHMIVKSVSQRTAVEELRESERRFREMLQNVRHIAIQLDARGKITFCNDYFLSVTGWKSDEVIGGDWIDLFIPPEQREEMRKYFDILVGGGDVPFDLGHENEIVTRNGERLLISWDNIILRDGKNNIVGTASIGVDVTESKLRRETEEQLKETTSQLEAIFKSYPDLLFQLKPDGTVVDYRAGRMQDLYVPPEQFLGKRIADVLPSDVSKDVGEAIERVVRTGSLTSCSYSLVLQDGREHFFEARLVPVSQEKILAIIREITEIKQKQEELRKSEQRFRMLAENVQDLIFRYRYLPERGFEYVSPSATAITGYTPEEHYADPELGTKIVHPEDRPILEALLRPPITAPGSVVLRWIRKDGRVLWTEMRYTPILDKNGNLIAIEGVSRDVSDRKLAEQMMQQNMRNMAILLDSLPGYAFLKDSRSVYVTANERFSRAVGCPKEEIPGKTDYDLFPRQMAEKFRSDDQRVLNSGEPVYVGEEEMIEGDRRITVATRKVPMRGDTGDVVGIVGLGFDIGERKHWEDELRKRLEYENLLARISADAVRVEDLSAFLNESLRMMGELMDVSRVYIFEYDDAQKTLSNTYEWVSRGVRSERARLQNMPISRFPLWMERMLRNEIIRFDDIDDIPSDVDRERLVPQGIKSILAVPLYLSDGTLYGFMGIEVCERKRKWSEDDSNILRAFSRIMTDVVERKAMESTISASEARYRAVFENTGTAIAIIEEDMTISMVNNEFARLSGFGIDEIVGKKWTSFVAKEDLARLKQYHQLRRKDPASVPRTYEFSFVDKEGSIRAVQATASMIPGTMKSIGSFVDVTELKKAERTVLESGRFLGSVFGSIQDGISVLDRDMNIVQVNSAMEKWYSHKMPLVGKKCYDAYRGRKKRCEVCPTVRVMRTQQAAHDVVPRIGPMGETVGWLDLYSFPLLDSDTGELKGVIEYVRDATDRKRYEDALKLANEKLQLLGSVTRHDALNQLSVLAGWLEIARGAPGSETVAEYLEKMKTSVDAIRNQLEFTADYEKMGLSEPAWVNAEDAFRRGVSGLGFEGVTVTCKLGGLEVFADPMLDKVFHNLLDNSLRHGKRVSEIKVHFKESRSGLTIVYEDNGIGIPDNEKKLIFHPGRGKHTGYGLFMVNSILGITGLSAEETGTPGEGARFEIHVPPSKYRVAAEGKS
ncbi:MAG: PAS domain S-box protein [Thermoplasmata archaeon]